MKINRKPSVLKVFLAAITTGIIIFFGSYQIYAESQITDVKLKALKISNKQRKRHFSLYIVYELNRKFNIEFQRQEQLYLNKLYKNSSPSFWDHRIDYYILHLYHSDKEKSENIK